MTSERLGWSQDVLNLASTGWLISSRYTPPHRADLNPLFRFSREMSNKVGKGVVQYVKRVCGNRNSNVLQRHANRSPPFSLPSFRFDFLFEQSAAGEFSDIKCLHSSKKEKSAGYCVSVCRIAGSFDWEIIAISWLI